MGTDAKWLIELEELSTAKEVELTAALKEALSVDIARVISSADGGIRVLRLNSNCHWTPVTPEATAEARHVSITRELEVIQRLTNGLPLYYGPEYLDDPDDSMSFLEAVYALEAHSSVNVEFTETLSLLKKAADGA